MGRVPGHRHHAPERQYRTQIYTSRTGEREFRMAHRASDKTTPAVRVAIG